MFKYCWIIMLAVMWIIWLIATVVDIIRCRWAGFPKLYTILEPYSQVFIIVTLFGIFCASLISWFASVVD